MFEMMYEANFTYDSSMPIYENNPPPFPFTFDYKVSIFMTTESKKLDHFITEVQRFF